jgi:hypothetical protein
VIVSVCDTGDLVQSLAKTASADGFEIHLESPSSGRLPGLWDRWRAAPVGLILYLGGAGEAAWTLARDARRRRSRLPVLYVGGKRDDWSSKGVPCSLIFEGDVAPRRLLVAMNGLLSKDAVSSAQPLRSIWTR